MKSRTGLAWNAGESHYAAGNIFRSVLVVQRSKLEGGIIARPQFGALAQHFIKIRPKAIVFPTFFSQCENYNLAKCYC